MNINGTLKINSVASGSTATEILVYNTGTTLVERRSTLPESSITFGTRFTNWNAYNSNGIVVQTSSTSWVARTITGPAAGITITNGNGVSGNPTLALSNDLAALEGLASTGFAVRTATDTWAQRTITGTVGQITVTNGNGVSGNPVLALDSTFVSNSSLWQLSGTGTFNVQSTSGFSSITSTGANNFCYGGTTALLNTITNGNLGNIFGGADNSITGNSTYNSILNGLSNIINSTSSNNTIIAGDSNEILNTTGLSIILGGFTNSITFGTINSILGGELNIISSTSTPGHNIILGGFTNTISGGSANTISGGTDNDITNGNSNSIICGTNNLITSVGFCNVILGGNSNNISGVTSGVTSNIILGGVTNGISSSGINNMIINSNNTTIGSTAANTTVIGQTTTTTITESNIVYIGKEIVGGKVAVTVLSAALANTSNTVYSNIISFNAKAGATYRLRLIGTYQTAATTTGIKVRMSGTAVANVAGYMQGQITAATSATGLRATIGTMTAELITTGVSAINTAHAIEGNIIVRCTTAGTVILQMASEVNASSAQLNIGTSVIVERVI